MKKRSPKPCLPPALLVAMAPSGTGVVKRSGLCLVALLASLFLASAGWAAVVDDRSSAQRQHRKQAQIETMELARLIAGYRHAAQANKTELLADLIDRATVRQALLGQLVQTDPDGAVATVLPSKLRTGMPAEVEARLEQNRELQGELEVLYEDYEDGRFTLRHILKTDAGRVELQRVGPAGGLQSGMAVRARGWFFQHDGETTGTLVLADSPDGLELLADSTATTTTSTSPSILPNTLGEQKTLVLLLNFQDNPVQPWTRDQAREMVFGTVNDFYRENSNNQTWLTGDVHGYYTLPINSTCDSWQIHVAAQQIAEDQGVDSSVYNRMVYVFPTNTACGWTGMGTVGGTVSRAWINGSLTLRTVGHELGHNLGLYHAKQLDCGSDIIDGRCISIEYGDSMDIMGSSGVTGHFNVFNKELLGWLTAASGEVVTADSDGSYLLEPYETALAGAAKGLKVLRGIDAVSGQPLWYYLEYRQALGFDGFLAGKAVTNGVVFHLGTEANANTSELLDMTPASIWYDLDDASLENGNSYTDSNAGVTVTTEWADATGASVRIGYSGPSCIPANPAVSLSPAESSWLAAGDTATYNVTVTNRDSSGCAASKFSIAAQVPDGWSADSGSLSLEPGASGMVTISITSAVTAVDDFYNIPILATSITDGNFQAVAAVTYVVETPAPVCVVANPLLTLSSDVGESVAPGTPVIYRATVTNQDSSGCEPAVFAAAATVPEGWDASNASVSLAPGESAVIDVSVTSVSDAGDGTYIIGINAANIANAGCSASAAASYNVAAPVAVCERTNPVLSLSAASSASVAAGTPVQFTGNLSNQDGSGCPASDFIVSAVVPTGWSAGTAVVNLEPGNITEVTLDVTSAADAAGGAYPVTIKVESVADPGSSSSVWASYLIAEAANRVPLAVADAVGLMVKAATIVYVLANDTDPDSDPLTVVQVTQGTQGSVQIIADGNVLYTPKKTFKGSDSFSYIVSDGRSTASSTVKVSLVKK